MYCSLGFPLKIQPCGYLTKKYDGKSGFVSHTKYIAEATNMDLFHL